MPEQALLTIEQASRFLRRATFGPSYADLQRLRELGIDGWVAEQFATQPIDRHADFIARGGPAARNTPRANPRLTFFETFWYQAAFGDDQLRQRMAFALSQIFVVSFEETTVARSPEGLGHYMDLLAEHAFGNFRTLLGAVARSPAMAHYLTHFRNERADRKTGRQPDENFAREVMQLFTIGLWELNPDGTPKRDAQGRLIPTYGQDEISGMARVFTGWSWGGGAQNSLRWRGAPIDGEPTTRWDVLMTAWPEKHESGEKQLIAGVRIPSGASPEASLDKALDILFEHPNTPPFIALRLIQRFVTSNPSPAYVKRVADVFRDNGNGVRGDLKAVLVAVLLDDEAWWLPGQSKTDGRLREPVLRFTQWFRAFGQKSWFETEELGRALAVFTQKIGQQPYNAPSVFNWYTPDFTPSGPIADADLVAPEFKLYDDAHIANYANAVVIHIKNGIGKKKAQSYEQFGTMSDNPDEFVQFLNQLMCAETMSEETVSTIRDAVAAVPAARRNERIWTGLAMTMLTPEYLVEV